MTKKYTFAPKILLLLSTLFSDSLAYPNEDSALSLYPAKIHKEYDFGAGDERGRNFKAPFKQEKDALYFLSHHKEKLALFYNALEKNSEKKQYARFRGRILITHNAYNVLDSQEKKALQGALVMSKFTVVSFMKYSEFGGIGVGGKIDVESEKFFSFDSRYLSDLQALGTESKIYALCVLPRFDKCILLGIGEFGI
ncbi:hypothetical protein [Helicobacter himalayensis]|uniref:hypothetical protein n=1 Tax=Helicobacter himalayensis TaxID=1591088 RepID=UPI0008310ACC|nr:hypothetical protein [Helicobacter himalayensis]